MTLKTLVVAAALMGGIVHAQSVDVKDAWVRTSVPGQRGTGAFMTALWHAWDLFLFIVPSLVAGLLLGAAVTGLALGGSMGSDRGQGQP